MRVLVGTSGFSYPEWRGHFYPEGLPASQMLHYYGDRLSAVEINNTFYRMPSAGLLASWLQQVPRGFVFAFKAPRRITHFARLVGVGDLTHAFLERFSEFGPALGPILFQLPPDFPEDLQRLEGFLSMLPGGLKAAVEFRHESWFTGRTFEVLRAHNVALCVSESETRHVPLVATASYGYLRLRRPDYSERDLTDWAQRVLAQPWSDAFAFFKHEEVATGPMFAARFAAAVHAEVAAERAAVRFDPYLR